MPDDPRKKAKSSPYILSKSPDKSQTYLPSAAGEQTASAPAQADRPTSSPDVKPVIPGYHLHRVLGEGGMGVVYLATHLELRRQVALKTLLVKYAANEMATKRFFAEAQIVASLKHPHIVEVYDFGQADQAPYLTMEYLTGGTLGDRLKDGQRLDSRSAAKLLLQIATGVGYAHEQGVIHRDLKPGNILFTADKSLHVEPDSKKSHGSTLRSAVGAVPKVTDFGLAKRGDTGMTATEATLGTPAYMAPEQAKKAKYVGPPADVWALGAILYECLTGRRPFLGDTAMAILMALHETEPPPLRSIVSTIPHDLETICLKCLSKNPDDRYDTATELADDLRRWLEGEPIDARRVTPVERAYLWVKRKPAFVSAVLLGVVGTIVAGLAVTTFIALRQSLHTSDQLAAEKKESEDARDREMKSRLFAETEKAAAETARDQIRVEQQKSEALRKEAEEARQAAEKARDGVVAAQTAEAKANAEATRIRDAQSAQEYTRNVQLAYQEYHQHNAAGANSLLDACKADLRGWEWKYVHRLCNSERLTLKGHGGRITSAAFSGNGEWVATGSSDNTVRLWDAKLGKETHALGDHQREVTSVAFSPDSSRLVTGSRDRTAKVWDTATVRTVSTLRGHGSWVTAVAFSPDGSRIATGSSDNTAKIWDAKTGTEFLTLRGHTREITAVAFSPDGGRVATGSYDETAKVWDAKTGAELKACQGHGDRVLAVCFTPDGNRLVTGSADQSVKVSDARTGLVQRTLNGHIGAVNAVAITRDGKCLLSGSADKTAKYWDLEAGTELATLQGHAGAVNAVAWTVDGDECVTAGEDQLAKAWPASLRTDTRPVVKASAPSLATPAVVKTPAVETRYVCPPPFSPDGSRVVLPEAGTNTANVWDTRTGQKLQALTGHTMQVAFAAFSPDGGRVVTASTDGTARVWNAATGQQVCVNRNIAFPFAIFHPGGELVLTTGLGAAHLIDAKTGYQQDTLSCRPREVTGAAISPNKDVIVGVSTDAVLVWELRPSTFPSAPGTWALRVAVTGHKQAITWVAFHPDGTRFVTASADQTAKIWNLGKGAEPLTLRGHTRGLLSAAFSPDGSRVVTTCSDGATKVWDAKTGSAALTVPGPANGLATAAFSPDGSRLLLVQTDGRVKVCDAKTGAETLSMTRDTRPVDAVAFSPDGSRYVEATGDQVVKVRDARTGAELLALKGHKDTVVAVAYSQDGMRIVTTSRDLTAKVWDAKTDKELLTLKGHTNAVTAAAFSPDGSAIVTTSADRTAKLWDAKTGEAVQTLTGHTNAVTAAAFSPDGVAIVTAGADLAVRVWDRSTGQSKVAQPTRHADAITSVGFSPDGSQIVTASADQTVKVWEAKKGTEILTIRGHATAVTAAAFSPDGKRVVTGDRDGTVKIWNAKTGTETLTLKGHAKEVTVISFSRNGSRLTTTGRGRVAKVWDAEN